MEANHEPHLKAKEGVVLDAEGNTVHDPMFGSEPHVRATWASQQMKNKGIVPKILLSALIAVLLIAGFAISAFVLGVIVVGFVFKKLLKLGRQ